MNQPNLFEDDRYRPPVRRTDPPTSHRGAEHIRPELTGLRLRMYEAFCVRPMTSNEAAAYCCAQLGGMHESYRKRTKELVRMRLIRPDLPRACGVTGQAAMVFRVVTR